MTISSVLSPVRVYQHITAKLHDSSVYGDWPSEFGATHYLESLYTLKNKYTSE